MRAAIYVRRSTEEHQQASLSVQREEATRFILERGWTLAEGNVFTDDAVSRAEFKKRPGLLAMLNAAEKRAFDVVVTRDETRLGGEMARTTLLIQDLLDAGARLFYYVSGEEVRLDDATAKFMIAAKNFAAELEREKIASRTAEHLLNKAKKGLNVGGRCFGYDNIEVREGDQRVRVEYAVNEAQAAIVREIFTLYSEGAGLKRIAKELNARGIPSPRSGQRGTGSWSPSVIHEMLRRPRYVGLIEYGRHKKGYKGGTKVRTKRPDGEVMRVEAPHLRIVDDETWRKVHARVSGLVRGPSKGGPAPRHLLSGLARCAECGGPMTVTNHKLGSHSVRVYVCSYHRSRGEPVCSNTARRPVDAVNDALISWINANILTESLTTDLLRRVRALLEERTRADSARPMELEKEARALRAEIDRFVDAVASGGSSSALLKALAEREQRLAEVDAQLRAQAAAPQAIRTELKRMEMEIAKRITDLRGVLERSPEEARALVRMLFPHGKLTAKPIATEQGRRFLLEGTASIGRLLASEQLGGPNWASPTGFEFELQLHGRAAKHAFRTGRHARRHQRARRPAVGPGGGPRIERLWPAP
jgi:site-specific DNA recombinase